MMTPREILRSIRDLPPQPGPGQEIVIWRERILHTLYLVGVGFGLLIMIPMSYLLLSQGMVWQTVLDWVITCWGACAVIWRRRLSFFVRATGALLVLYLIGVTVLWSLGPISGGPVWMFSFGVCCSVLFGLRWGMAAIALNTVTLLIFAWFIAKGLLPWAAVDPGVAPRWLGLTMNFVMLSVVVNTSAAVLARGLNSALRREKQAKEKLWDEKESFRALTEESPLGISLRAADGKTEYLNPEFTRLFGYTLAEVPDRDSWLRAAYPDPDYRKMVMLAFKKNEPQPRTRNFRITCKDGSVKSVQLRATMLSGGKQLVIYDDVTERAKNEAALIASEARFRQLVKFAPAGIVELDVDTGLVISANKVMEKISGFAREELEGMDPAEHLTPEGREEYALVLAAMRRGQALGETREVRFDKKQGGYYWAAVSVGGLSREDGKTRATVILNDITLKKIAEKALRDNERRFREMADALPAVVLETGPDQVITYINRIGAGSFGYRAREMEGRLRLLDLAGAEDQAALARWHQAVGRGESPPPTELRLLRKDGSVFIGLANGGPIMAEGRPAGTRVNILDLSPLKEAEQALEKSRVDYKALFENINDFICTHDLEGRLLSLNPVAAARMNRKVEELIGLPIPSALNSRQRKLFQAYMKEITEKGKADGIVKLTLPGAEKLYLEYRNNLVARPGEEPYVTGVGRDISERIQNEHKLKALSAQLQQAQKMEALGTLAGGVAHEFNNILMSIRGYAQLMRAKTGENGDLADYLARIEKSTAQASELTSTMLGFSRKGGEAKAPVDPAELFAELGTLLKNTLNPAIKVEMDLADGLPVFSANHTHLLQVLLNLAVNARDAMPEGGVLRFKVRHGRPLSAQAPDPQRADGTLEITVSDTGAGMTRQLMDRIFDPFFTTKEPGRGTGLGLSVAYNLIASHGGDIRVNSRPGMGSSFVITLPVKAEAEQKPLPKKPAATPASGTGQRILVADDEEFIREIVREALSGGGYRVTTTADGREALEAYMAAREQGLPFDLVILDLAMPKMDGIKCAAQIYQTDPAARIIMATGHTKDAPDVMRIPPQVALVLAKPFDLTLLISAVAEALAGPPPVDTPPAP